MPTGEILLIVGIARRLTRPDFVAQHGGFYLVGADTLVRPMGPSRTLGPDALSPVELARLRTDPHAYLEPPGMGPSPILVLPVRKNQTMFSTMITLGRTQNNDIILSDVSISKFHAWFKIDGSTVEVYDAGSRNGTFVGEARLVPKGPPERITSGVELRFGGRKFLLLDAGATWDYIHKR